MEYSSSVDANLTGTNVGGLVGNVNMGGGFIKYSSLRVTSMVRKVLAVLLAHSVIQLLIVAMQYPSFLMAEPKMEV